MNRVWDYIRFAVWFSGVGYIVLWPFTAHDNGLAAMSFACGLSFTPFDFICTPRAGLPLSPGLHLAGMMSSAFVMMCLALRPLRRWRVLAAKKGGQALLSIIRARTNRRRTLPPQCRYVQSRSHFGLRNPPH